MGNSTNRDKSILEADGDAERGLKMKRRYEWRSIFSMREWKKPTWP